MDATLYKELSDAQEVVQIEAGRSIRDNFPWLDLSKRIILVNGIETSQDYIAQVNDIIMIRSVPYAVTTAVIIALAVVATVGAVVGGVALYKLRKQLDSLQDSLKNVNESVRNIPYLRGAQNALATGNSQPYIIGEHLFTPYLITGTYSKLAGTDGADQYFYAVLENGFNKQVVRNLKCDDVVLKDWGSELTTPQEGVFTFDESSVFYDADSLIEVAQDGNAFATAAFNKKVFESSPGTQLLKADNPDYEDLIFTLPEKTRAAEVCILINGLRAYNDNGSKIDRTVTVIPEYQLVDEGAWTAFTFDQNGTPSNEFTRNVVQQLRFVARVDFTYAQVGALTAPVKIRLRCTTDAYDGSVRDDVYVQWVQSEIYDPIASATLDDFVDEPILGDTERSVSTLVGLKIKVTASNEEKLSRINCISSGVARTWTGSAWSVGKVPTSNPAAWLLEVLTSHTHKASQADDSEIDLGSFGELYEYCDTNELSVDMVLIDGDTKESVLARILETCFSVLYRDIYGQISVAIDSPKSNAIALFNTQNVISFENTKSLGRRTDGVKISYVSRDAGYVQSSYLIMRSGVTRTADSILRDVSVSGIVEYEHIVKYARRLMAIEALRPKTVSVQVGKEGIYYTPLSKVLIQHPSLKVGIGSAEIKYVIDDGAYITGLVLYEPVAYDPDNVNGFGAVIAAVGDDYYTPLAAAYIADEISPVEIELVTPIALTAPVIPHAGDVLSYGLLSSGTFDTITTPMLIAGVTPNDQGHTLQLVDYNAAVYDVGEIPAYTPNFTLYVDPGSIPDTVIPEGLPGTPGYRTATMTLYKWLSSAPTGSWPTGFSTYTWATGEWTLPATPNSWVKNPASPAQGQKLYAINLIATNNNTDAESTVYWLASPTYNVVGSAGTDGTPGDDGKNTELRYAKNTSATTGPAFTAAADNPGASWSATAPSLATNEYLWRIESVWLGTERLTNWTGLVRMSGISAPDSPDGSINAAKLIDATLSMTKFAAGIRPPRVVSSLPANPYTGYALGDMVVLTSDGKLYRMTNMSGAGTTGWNKSTDGADIVANSITAGQLAAGAIGADQIAAGAITANKLAVVSRNTALNIDPSCMDATAWTFGAGDALNTIIDGKSGTGVIRGGVGTSHTFSKQFPVDAGKKFRLRGWFRAVSATHPSYFRIYWYTGTGAAESYASCFEATTIPSAWTRYESIEITPPAGVVNAAIGLILNYQGTAGYTECQDIRAEEAVPAVLIQDGAITADKIAANTITAGQVNSQSLFTTDFQISTAGKIWAGSSAFGNAAGMFLGRDGSAWKFSLSDKLTWNGSVLEVNGKIKSGGSIENASGTLRINATTDEVNSDEGIIFVNNARAFNPATALSGDTRFTIDNFISGGLKGIVMRGWLSTANGSFNSVKGVYANLYYDSSNNPIYKLLSFDNALGQGSSEVSLAPKSVKIVAAAVDYGRGQLWLIAPTATENHAVLIRDSAYAEIDIGRPADKFRNGYFSGNVSAASPTASDHLATKEYVDTATIINTDSTAFGDTTANTSKTLQAMAVGETLRGYATCSQLDANEYLRLLAPAGGTYLVLATYHNSTVSPSTLNRYDGGNINLIAGGAEIVRAVQTGTNAALVVSCIITRVA